MQSSASFEIKVEGNINSSWSDWFGGLCIQAGPNNETVLSGVLKDQADLHGVLMKIRDLHLTLISVNRIKITNEEDLKSGE